MHGHWRDFAVIPQDNQIEELLTASCFFAEDSAHKKYLSLQHPFHLQEFFG